MEHSGSPGPVHHVLDVVVVGEALIDVVTLPDGITEHPGGSPANVAYGLGRLGVSTGLHTALGRDRRGAALEKHLAGAEVTLLPDSHPLEATSTATVTIAPDGSASYAFDIAWDLNPLHVGFAPPKVVHTGSIASFLAPGAGRVRAFLQQVPSGCTVTYDPNIRPDLLGSHTEALSIFEDLVHLTGVVKLSDEDARWLYPRRTLEETAGHILNLGAELAVITQGSDGSLLATPTGSVCVPAVRTEVADTIGAGDSYMSALILGLLTRATDGMAPAVIEQLGRTAATAAAITVGRPGANPPSYAELRNRMGERQEV
ncbi:MAG: carbohydrate kinase [Pseudarthrobacter sp.]|nr:carbohydrate kinase [Pseudarthrobacter sp.]